MVLTTSGQSAYTDAIATIITRSMRLCGVIDEEETPSSAQIVTILDTFSALVKGWQASGIHVWSEEECILFLQPNQNQYGLGPASTDHACLFTDLTQSTLSVTASSGATTLSATSVTNYVVGDSFGVQLDAGTNFWSTITAISGMSVTVAAALPSQATAGAITFDYTNALMRPLRVPEGRRYQYLSQTETPLIPLSRFDYDYLPNKYNTGTVTQFFFDPQQGKGAYSNPTALINVWPAPSDNSSGIRFVAQRPLQAVTSIAQVPDFPDEWLPALCWNLAVEIAPEYDVPADRFDRLKAKAEEWFTRAAMWDKEPESLLFGYATTQGYRT